MSAWPNIQKLFTHIPMSSSNWPFASNFHFWKDFCGISHKLFTEIGFWIHLKPQIGHPLSESSFILYLKSLVLIVVHKFWGVWRVSELHVSPGCVDSTHIQWKNCFSPVSLDCESSLTLQTRWPEQVRLFSINDNSILVISNTSHIFLLLHVWMPAMSNNTIHCHWKQIRYDSVQPWLRCISII